MAVNRQNEPHLFMEPVTFRKAVRFEGTVGLRVLSSQYAGHGIAPGKLVASLPTGLAAADHANLDHADRIAGILISPTELITAGELAAPALWTFVSAGLPLYVGTDGVMIPTPPATGFQQKIGVTTGGSSLILTFGDAIILA